MFGKFIYILFYLLISCVVTTGDKELTEEEEAKKI